MLFSEVVAQERGGPDRRAVARLTRVRLDHLLDEWVDDAEGGARSPVARAVGDSGLDGEVSTRLEASGPVVDGLAGDAQAGGYCRDAVAPAEP